MSDEARSERLHATPEGVRLARLEDIADGDARGFVLQLRAGRFHGFVVRRGGRVSGFSDLCPHMGLPLAQVLDGYLTPAGDMIACSWHGALFDPLSGACLAGPCAGRGLTPWPVRVRDGWIETGPDAIVPAADR